MKIKRLTGNFTAYRRCISNDFEADGGYFVGKTVMMAHQKAMEKTKQSIAALRAEQEAIQRELALMEEERNVAKRAIQSVDEEMDPMKAGIKEANAKLEASVQELKKNIAAKEKLASLQERNKKQLKNKTCRRNGWMAGA